MISSVIIPVFRVTYRTEHQRMSHWQSINRNNLGDAVLMLYKGTCQRVSRLISRWRQDSPPSAPCKVKAGICHPELGKGKGQLQTSIRQGGLEEGTAWKNRAETHQLNTQSTRQGLGSAQARGEYFPVCAQVFWCFFVCFDVFQPCQCPEMGTRS